MPRQGTDHPEDPRAGGKKPGPRNPSDQRSFQLFLTDEGLAIHQHAEAIMSRVHDELFAPLTPVEQATLVHLLDQCLAAQPLEDI